MIPGLASPWKWIQPRTDAELIERLIQAREYNVHERERENLCSCAAGRLTALAEKLAQIEQRANESGTGEMAERETIYAIHAIARRP